MDLAVLVSRLAKTFSLFERLSPMSFFVPALLSCTRFGFEAAAAEWGLGLKILTLKPPVFLSLWVWFFSFSKVHSNLWAVLVPKSTCAFEMFLPEKGPTGSPQVLHCLGRKMEIFLPCSLPVPLLAVLALGWICPAVVSALFRFFPSCWEPFLISFFYQGLQDRWTVVEEHQRRGCATAAVAASISWAVAFAGSSSCWPATQ